MSLVFPAHLACEGPQTGPGRPKYPSRAMIWRSSHVAVNQGHSHSRAPHRRNPSCNPTLVCAGAQTRVLSPWSALAVPFIVERPGFERTRAGPGAEERRRGHGHQSESRPTLRTRASTRFLPAPADARAAFRSRVAMPPLPPPVQRGAVTGLTRVGRRSGSTSTTCVPLRHVLGHTDSGTVRS